ncbi:flagellar hook capping FlgD N-terminal domain-containing protein [Kamptonema cortianum]|nr:flagellar hook capping FlgD N-terminal domain-containing protein [Geitlerinema splendidum]MDK3156045.1 flagellar hook capping FlgD N-terminal domain-containing protein [Kamptonema cortianum]
MIDALGSKLYTNSGGAAKPKSELSMDTFLRLLTVQLANQNPLEPMNDRDFFAQMAQLGQVEGMDDLKAGMEVLNSSAMIGKKVIAVRPMTEEGSGGVNGFVEGTVTQMTVKNGKRILGVREANGGLVEVELANIRQVSQ